MIAARACKAEWCGLKLFGLACILGPVCAAAADTASPPVTTSTTTSTLLFEAEEECGPPTVAFVVPFYDEREDELTDTIQSIVKQEGFTTPFLIVVSDDGGPYPERPQNVLAWTWRFGPPRMCSTGLVLRGPNGRLPMARERALASLPAGVEWLVNVDTGDRLDARLMRLSFAALAARPELNLIHPHLCATTGFQWDPPELAVASVPLHRKNALHCCPMYRKSLWEGAGGYDASFAFGWEDWDFWVRANMTVGIKSLNLPERCLYHYTPGGLHRVCERDKQACDAAFATAHGNLYGVEDTLRAHDTLLQSTPFLSNDALQRQRQHYPDAALMWLWAGLLREAAGDTPEALRSYRAAAALDAKAHVGMRLTRGVGWQAAYRGRRALEGGKEPEKLEQWCADMGELLLHEGYLLAESPEWQVVACPSSRPSEL